MFDDMAGDFLRQRKRETHSYLFKATSVEIVGKETGAFVAGGSTFRKEPIPGKKKSSGETLWLALTPLQPAANNPIAARIANRNKFQFNLTRRL